MRDAISGRTSSRGRCRRACTNVRPPAWVAARDGQRRGDCSRTQVSAQEPGHSGSGALRTARLRSAYGRSPRSGRWRIGPDRWRSSRRPVGRWVVMHFAASRDDGGATSSRSAIQPAMAGGVEDRRAAGDQSSSAFLATRRRHKWTSAHPEISRARACSQSNRDDSTRGFFDSASKY